MSAELTLPIKEAPAGDSLEALLASWVEETELAEIRSWEDVMDVIWDAFLPVMRELQEKHPGLWNNIQLRLKVATERDAETNQWVPKRYNVLPTKKDRILNFLTHINKNEPMPLDVFEATFLQGEDAEAIRKNKARIKNVLSETYDSYMYVDENGEEQEKRTPVATLTEDDMVVRLVDEDVIAAHYKYMTPAGARIDIKKTKVLYACGCSERQGNYGNHNRAKFKCKHHSTVQESLNNFIEHVHTVLIPAYEGYPKAQDALSAIRKTWFEVFSASTAEKQPGWWTKEENWVITHAENGTKHTKGYIAY